MELSHATQDRQRTENVRFQSSSKCQVFFSFFSHRNVN